MRNLIISVRGVNVMLESDVADMHEIEVKNLNRQVKRNIERFPSPRYMFQLTEDEKKQIINDYPRFNKLKISNNPPNAFTEHGILMLCLILESETAIAVRIKIIESFIESKK